MGAGNGLYGHVRVILLGLVEHLGEALLEDLDVPWSGCGYRVASRGACGSRLRSDDRTAEGSCQREGFPESPDLVLPLLLVGVDRVDIAADDGHGDAMGLEV